MKMYPEKFFTLRDCVCVCVCARDWPLAPHIKTVNVFLKLGIEYKVKYSGIKMTAMRFYIESCCLYVETINNKEVDVSGFSCKNDLLACLNRPEMVTTYRTNDGNTCVRLAQTRRIRCNRQISPISSVSWWIRSKTTREYRFGSQGWYVHIEMFPRSEHRWYHSNDDGRFSYDIHHRNDSIVHYSVP